MGALTGRVFRAPPHYLQGPGVLDDVGEVVAPAHRRAVVVVDAALPETVGARLVASLATAGVAVLTLPVAGEVTAAHIAGLADRARPAGAGVVVAAGGGKTLDLGKGVARALGLGMVSVPTIASTDGPTSRLIALYDEDHRLIDTPRMPHNPEAVVVDTALVAGAPARFLVAGIGDALAKRFEAAACARGAGPTSNGTRPLRLPGIIADGCYRTLLADGAAAVAAVRRGRAGEVVERVVEAVVLMSGLAFENGGLSLAHAMTRGLLVLPGAAGHLHGAHVAYGLLVQLTHERREEDLGEVRTFLGAVGLPRSLTELDAIPDAAAVRVLTEAVVRSPHLANCVPRPTPASVTAAITRVEADGRSAA